VRNSRRLIIGEEAPYRASFPVFTMRGFLANLAKSGSAIALSAALLFLLVGSFSLWRIFVPQGTALIDPAGLRAEAQAIDIQIELSNLAYHEPAAALSNETSSPFMAMTAPRAAVSPDVSKEAQTEAENLGIVPPSSSTATTSINDALDELSR